MNLLLLTAAEATDPLVRLRGDRARHIREVLHANPGDQLKVGVLDGPLGRGVIRTVSSSAVTLECRFEAAVPDRSEDSLLLAIPRPPVLARCLTQAATLGFGRIVLVRSWRVDKSHLGSKVLEGPAIRRLLVAGLAQGRRTRVPEVQRFDLFKPFVEDRLDSLVPDGQRFVGDPNAETGTAAVRLDATAPFTLAIGPEGGFIPFEVRALQDRGFQAIHGGPHPLKVESAIAYLAGQLHLLRSQSTS